MNWTQYYDLPDRYVEDERVWRDCMSQAEIKTDPVTGKRSVDYDPTELRSEGECLISIKENRLHLCFSLEQVITVPDGVRSIASGAFTNDSTPNLRHLILPMSVDGVGFGAIDCRYFDELTYYNNRIHVCNNAFNEKQLRLLHCPPENATWNVAEERRRHAERVCWQQPEPPRADDDNVEVDMDDLPF
ncbi:MAG: hypothetical protein IKW20_02225 [Bacteroidales bacterium]|nr:hypothetical protein [Bacteroidales bacterium]